MRSHWIQFIALAAASSFASAQDMVVVIDVSGSMAHYGSWQAEVLSLVTSIAGGEPVRADAFEPIGALNAAEKFRLQPGQTLHIVPFGSVDTDGFPYFKGIRSTRDAGGLSAIFPLNSSSFRSAQTNKPLATAVAASLAAYEKNEARLFVISDFLVDADLTSAQQQYVNQFESNSHTETPLILSWKKDRRVQLKLIRVRALTTSQTPPPTLPSATVQLLSAKLTENPRRVQCAWKASSPDVFQSYTLTIRNPATRKTVFTRVGLLGTSGVYPDPPSGKYAWQVVGTLADGGQVSSPAGQFEVEGSWFGGFLLGLAAIGCLGAGLWWFNSKKKRKDEDAWGHTEKKESR